MTSSPLDDLLARLERLPDAERREVIQAAKRATAGMLWTPNVGQQTAAYFTPAEELFYGGEAGGGKTDLLLGLALNAHTTSRLFRRHHGDRLAMVKRLQEILGGSKDGYNGHDHIWSIPGTSKTILFGAMSKPDSWESYQGDPTDLKGWDEITQFLRHEFQTVNIWNRSTVPGQRSRIVATGNPPITPEGLWVIEHWAPWLDEHHRNPAKAGELRYFATVDGREDVEVDASWRGLDAKGKIVLPTSRTFIPAGLDENPDLADTGYGSKLMNLPPHLRDAFAYGMFKSHFDDAERQIIPTDWIIMAQERWLVRGKADIENLPMACLGVDMADNGPDDMVATPLHGTTLGEPQVQEKPELNTTAQQVSFIVGNLKNDAQINIDCGGGYGGGAASALESNHFNVLRWKGGETSGKKERYGEREFHDCNAEVVWRFREGLDPEKGDDMALPPGRDIIAQLTSFREAKHPEARTVIKLEPMADLKKRLGRSPDKAISMFLSWAEPDHERALQRRSMAKAKKRGGNAPVVHRYGNVKGRR